MENLEYWKLCDELNVFQAVLLTLGLDPAGEDYYVEQWAIERRPKHYEAVKTAIQNAVIAGTLPATVKYSGYYETGYVPLDRVYEATELKIALKNQPDIVLYTIPDWNISTIKVNDLKQWLERRGFKRGFFFENTSQEEADYLNPNHENYAPKLAAGIHGWEYTSKHPEYYAGKTVKQGLQKWLRENAALYGLTKDDGSPNEQAIEDISKVANWDISGGAPASPIK